MGKESQNGHVTGHCHNAWQGSHMTGNMRTVEDKVHMSQTSFGHISINSLMILMVLMAMKSPWEDLFINTGYVSKRSVLAEILGRSTGNHYGTIY